MHTSYNSFYKWTKFLVDEMTIFGLKMTLKSGLEFFIFHFEIAPSELLLPSAKKFARKAEIAWLVSRTSEGARFISQKKSRPLLTSFLSKNGYYKS